MYFSLIKTNMIVYFEYQIYIEINYAKKVKKKQQSKQKTNKQTIIQDQALKNSSM